MSEPLHEKEIERNTQLRRQIKHKSLSRNYATNDCMLRCKHIQIVFFTDTMFATKHKSRKVNKCCQVFASDKGYISAWPMKSQDEFDTAFHYFFKEVGIPVDLIEDGFSAQRKPSVKRSHHQVGITLKVIECATSWTNWAELCIWSLNEAFRKDTRESNSPMVLCDCAIERRTLIRNAVPRALLQDQGKTPHECTFGNQSRNSNVCNFGLTWTGTLSWFWFLPWK